MLVSILGNEALSIADAGRPFPKLSRGEICVRACDHTGRPFAGVSFRLFLPYVFQVCMATDKNGEARFSRVAPGAYWLREDAPESQGALHLLLYTVRGEIKIDGRDARTHFFMAGGGTPRYSSSKQTLSQEKSEITQITKALNDQLKCLTNQTT